jgi:hypothetical protein
MHSLGGGVLFCLLLAGCGPATWGVLEAQNSSVPTVLSSQVISSGNKICEEASRQLDRLQGSDEVLIRDCETRETGNNSVEWRIHLNDFSEWSRLIATQSTEDIIFTVPLALVAYSFVASEVNESLFDDVVIAFNDTRQTEYSFTTKDLASVLSVTEPREVAAELRALQFKMRISTRN